MGHDLLKRYRKDTTSSSILCCSIGACRHHQSRREKPTWSGRGKLERGRGVGEGCGGSPRPGEKPGASAAPRPRREGRPRPDTGEPLRRGPPAQPRLFSSKQVVCGCSGSVSENRREEPPRPGRREPSAEPSSAALGPLKSQVF